MSTDAVDQEDFDWFVGIDWGTAEHTVDIGDAAGTSVAGEIVAHTSASLAQWVDRLGARAGGRLDRVAVAIEVPRGAVVELLLERGAAVFALNPKQLDRFRDRFSVAGAKDDRLDARVLRSALRTDRERFRRLTMDEPLVIRIRELTQTADDLQQEGMALTNRLRALVHRIAPEWLLLSPAADDPWFWAVLVYAATPRLGHQLRAGKLARVLKQYRIRRISAVDALEILRRPPLIVAPGTIEAVTAHIQLLLPRLRLAAAQRHTCEKALRETIAELATADAPDDADPEGSGPPGPGDIAILQSLPGVGTGVTAALVADARRLLHGRDYAGLRAVTGVAPVRRQTGKNKQGLVSMRYACNTRLRNACYHWARVSTSVDAAARQYYAALRARGHSHGRALRSVADRWLRILIAMLKTRTLYDPTRRFISDGGLPPAIAV